MKYINGYFLRYYVGCIIPIPIGLANKNEIKGFILSTDMSVYERLDTITRRKINKIFLKND